MKKALLVLGAGFLIWLSKSSLVQAGGCCFTSLQVSKTGIAGANPVYVSSTLYNSEYNPTSNPVKYRIGESVDVKIVDPKPGQRCETPVVTDSSGRLSTACYADTAEAMTIYFMTTQAKLNGQLIKSAQTTFYFANQDGPLPTAIPTPTSQPVWPTPTPISPGPPEESQVKSFTTESMVNQPGQTQQTDQQGMVDLENKIADLEKTVEEQQKKISLLENVVQRISDLFKKIFRI